MDLNLNSSSPSSNPCNTATTKKSQNNNNNNNNNSRFGLIDLFGGNRWERPKETSGSIDTSGSEQHKGMGTPSRQGLHLPKLSHSDKSSKFFTLRMEHRQGGTLAKYPGEERVLLFRSDQAGAIAKIVFSSSPVLDPSDDDSSKKHYYCCQPPHNMDERQIITIAANATVHVLFVKDTYRGFNLGGLLFGLCVTHLRDRYGNCNPIDSGVKNRPSAGISSIRCRLDAEEDIRRHDKLVHFYEHLGLRKKRRAKANFIHNNDGETYRRIPMTMDLLLSPLEQGISNCNETCISAAAAAYSSFLPALLVSASGERAKVLDNRSIVSWWIVECQDGNIELRTTDGRMLRSDGDGRCRLVPVPSSPCATSASSDSFRLLRVSDMLDKVMYDREEEQSCIQENLLLQQQQQQFCALTKEKELWMIRSSVYDTFMGMTCDHDLVFSEKASFWQADENFCLTHTSDSPARRQHHRRMWMKQSVEYVTFLHERYSAFDLCCRTIDEALDLTKHLPANPFSVSSRRRGEHETNTERRTAGSSLPSVRTFLFHTAELARKEGHPDWVQFVALIHGLAGAMTCLRASSSGGSVVPDEVEGDDFDWTIYVDARVMGCETSKTSTFAEFRHLNPDEGDTRYNTPNGLYREHVGLENVLLSWTSSDYMYCMLKHNRVVLPKEAYAILKLFPLVDWHTRGKHISLSSENDEELKLFVADFYELFQRSQDKVLSAGGANNELSDKECRDLWTNHYSLIAKKYGAGDILKW